MRGGASTAMGSGVRASHPSGLGRECGRAAGARQTFYCLALSLTAFGLALGCAAPGSGAPKKHYPQEEVVSIYVVEHGLVDMSVNASKPLQLTDEGLRHKDAVTAAMSTVPLTDVFASHTRRSRQTVEDAAAAHSVAVVQLPTPGKLLNGQIVTDETPRVAAIQPISKALLHLKKGSNVLYAGNSENIYAILSNLGIPVLQGCKADGMCVPCADKTCFDMSDTKALWHLTIRPHRPEILNYQKTYLAH